KMSQNVAPEKNSNRQRRARHGTWHQMALFGTPTKDVAVIGHRWSPRLRTLQLRAPTPGACPPAIFLFRTEGAEQDSPGQARAASAALGLSDGIDRHAESVRPFSSPSRTLSACKSIVIPHPRAALAARACPGLPCHAPSVRKRFRAWRSRSKNLSAPQPV